MKDRTPAPAALGKKRRYSPASSSRSRFGWVKFLASSPSRSRPWRGVRPASDAEVPQQVRLVEVAGVESHVDGARALRGVEPGEHRVQPDDAGEQLRADAELAREHALDPPPAPAERARDVGDAGRATRLEQQADGRSRRGGGASARERELGREPVLGRREARGVAPRRGERLHERPRARPADDRGERRLAARRPGHRDGQERRHLAGPEPHSERRDAAPRAQQPRPRQGARQEGPPLSPPAPAHLPRERVPEVHDQLRAAVRHDALGRPSGTRPRVRDEPQAFEVRPQRGARPVLDVAQRHPLSARASPARRRPRTGSRCSTASDRPARG